MIRLSVKAADDVAARVLEGVTGGPAEALQLATRAASVVPLENAPFVDMPYREVPVEYFDRVFGYAGITESGGAFGVPGRFAPAQTPNGLLVFDLAGYREYLAATFPGATPEMDPIGAFRTTEYDSPEEFLLAGTVACIAFAEQAHAILAVRW